MGVWTAYLAVAAAVLGACGDGLKDGSYRGEPLHVLEGWVKLDTTETAPGVTLVVGELRVAVFWSRSADALAAGTVGIEQDVATGGSFPARYRLVIYEPPPDELLVPVLDGSGHYAFALVLAYVDGNGDGAWNRRSERLVGGAVQRLLVYTPDGVESATFGKLAKGFHHLEPKTQVCASGLPTVFAPDPNPDLELTISMTFPTDVVLDLDCDGDSREWWSLCPPLETIFVIRSAPGGSLGPATIGSNPCAATSLPNMRTSFSSAVADLT